MLTIAVPVRSWSHRSDWYTIIPASNSGQLVDVAEVRVLAIRQVIKTMSGANLLSELAVLLLVAEGQVEPQEGNDAEKRRVAAKMDGERLQVAGIVVEEDLGAGGVTGAPGEEVQGDADGLLGLATDVSREHTHSETLSGPESEDNPVADEQASSCCVVLVLDSHDDNGTNESSVKNKHGVVNV